MHYPVIMYHRLVDRPVSKFDVTWVQFREQMKYLAASGYVGESVARLDARLCAHELLPERYVVLTFDDGNDTDYEVSRLLDAHGFTGTFCIITDRIDAPGHLTRPQMIEMAARHDLCSHSASHRTLSTLTPSESMYELRASKRRLEKLLHRPCETICVPFGAVSARIYEQARSVGYRLVGNSTPAFNTADRVRGTGRLNRICITRDLDLGAFRRIVAGKRSAVAGEWARHQLVRVARNLLPHSAFNALRKAV
jgi:peptidoglycan/xylan/chitin deacetylase (PgdA/CDA1 family)